MMIMNAIPKKRKVLMTSYAPIKYVAKLAVKKAEKPNPSTVSPTARPLLSGNHLADTATGQPYAIPTPSPPMTPYVGISIDVEPAMEASSQPSPQMIPPVIATLRGPYFSIYLPEKTMATEKTKRNIENGRSTSLADTV
jgi:hypothetical protein